ncbi:hypothetical protein CPAR01_13962 [Colletotrichum paranaense]|uniref:Uncharacterized protein n=1 Tax=Colletotrichum paranaense TaxID=1914294 RepID=A0ABQ9S2S5_9PEZI|nr:uncharacterized protein CPAR01_13962 [Colletotrichum paranaense]KAK1523109.1 hypothetical protein CPAR01_13962 [Colletotrichum paranaense]
MVGNYCADLTGERQILVSHAPSRRFKFHLMAGVVPRSVPLPDECPSPSRSSLVARRAMFPCMMSQVHAGRRAHHFGRLGCFYSCFLDHEYCAGGKDLDLLAAGAPRELGGMMRGENKTGDLLMRCEAEMDHGRGERLAGNLSSRQAHTVLGRGGRRFCDPISLPHVPCNDSQMNGQ